ncbi:hypothetical protein NITHO_1470010 [Nitrolancea hollandica Lb]|uniref:Uncharacterized protein n=1 Tax=Nitrolancea hollandica Lb TaxID=1129897 RepID=I4EDE5_9BACT|nr:hypothetical protein NITHO_1470010 [Nitrolancea hollandica Lb]
MSKFSVQHCPANQIQANKKPQSQKGRGSPAVPPLLTPAAHRRSAHSTRDNGRYPAGTTGNHRSPRRLWDEFTRSTGAGLSPFPGSLDPGTRYCSPSSPI